MLPSSTELVRELIEISPATAVGRTPSSELHAIVDAVLEDQGELDRTVLRLREMCAPLSRNQPFAEPGPAALIEELEPELIGHFVVERAEELYAGLFVEEPCLLERVERLQIERGEIVEALDQLIECAHRVPPDPDLAMSVGRLLDWVDLHERAENAVMQEFLHLAPDGAE